MTSANAAALSQAILALHLAVIAFNVAGLIAIPLGGVLNWRFVRVGWWRALHIASWAVVALQAVLGRACFLTLWQDQMSGAVAQPPLIERWVERVVYWPLPIWVFAAIYLTLFAAVLAMWFVVPPRRGLRVRRFGRR